jgi:hypothetical protein
LAYGTSNQYKPGAPGAPPAIGQPPVADAPFLQQRSNATFTSIENRDSSTGKTILASSFAQRKIIIIVQPNGAAPAPTYTTLRNQLAALWVDQAVFLDGSDSVFMWFGGSFVVQPGGYKNNLDTVAIGFT